MAEKDQVIKRLYVKVKQLSEAKTPAQSTRSPLRAATRSGRVAAPGPEAQIKNMME